MEGSDVDFGSSVNLAVCTREYLQQQTTSHQQATRYHSSSSNGNVDYFPSPNSSCISTASSAGP